jgi:hypothetical protein
MTEDASQLMQQFLAWIAGRPRSYAETMDAWRSSCPRLTIWEDALMEGQVQIEEGEKLQQSKVTLTDKGRELLEPKSTRQTSSFG